MLQFTGDIIYGGVTMENKVLFERVSDESLGKISGGVDPLDNVSEDVTEISDIGSGKDVIKKSDYVDEKGVYHVICKECGKEITSWKSTTGKTYPSRPQLCDECNKKKKNKGKRR